jgi:hypothetical protein
VPDGGVTGSTTVVVIGEHHPQYSFDTFGVKLAEVRKRRTAGQLIYVIREHEFDDLLKGQELSMADSQSAATGRISEFGVAYRPPKPSRLTTRPSMPDLDARDTRTRAHQELVEMVVDKLEARGLEPLQSTMPSRCAYDIGWKDGRKFHVVKVKTIDSASDSQQVWLGLGQVLDYRTRLRQWHNGSVQAHLVVTGEPEQHLIDTCAAAKVKVTFPPYFIGLFSGS